MKKQNFHLGSFVVGVLAGGVILMLLAMSRPLHTETQTSQLLRKESQQIQTNTSRSIDQTWLQVRSGLSASWQRNLRMLSQTIRNDYTKVIVDLHGSSFQPCTWFIWLDRQFVHFAALLKLHFAIMNPVCRA